MAAAEPMPGSAAMALPAQLTMQDARQALASLQAWLAGPSPLLLDASTLVGLDTAALALLLELQRQAAASGKRIELSGAPAKLVQLARLYGVAELIDR